MKKEVQVNRAFVRDEETNALIPVVRAFSEGIDNVEVSGNVLFQKDEETNALVPVVFIEGLGDSSGGEVNNWIQKDF